MHLSVSTGKLPLFLSLFSNLIIATPAPAPVPIPAITAYGNGPIKLPIFSGGAAVQRGDDFVKVFYQFDDGAIHELDGTSIPVDNEYIDQIVVKPGQARVGSPLAVVDLSGELDLRLYYINPYNQLKELVRSAGDKYWFSGALDELKIYVQPDSQYLWTTATFNEYHPLVGYVSPTGVLSAAGNNGSWYESVF